MRFTFCRAANTGRAALLSIALAAIAGCSNDWALGGLPGEYSPMAQTQASHSVGSGGMGLTGIDGGLPELVGLLCVLGAVAAVALAAEGLRRLFGGS